MAKREVPLFIIDTARRHKKGECEWMAYDADNECVVGAIMFNELPRIF